MARAKPVNPTKMLSDLVPGDFFLYVARVTAVDATAGLDSDLYGPHRSKTASAHINIDGSMTGQLIQAPNVTPVSTIQADFAPVSVGDILENASTGETLVCRVSSISDTGEVLWSSSVNSTVTYTAGGDWNVIGHVDL